MKTSLIVMSLTIGLMQGACKNRKRNPILVENTAAGDLKDERDRLLIEQAELRAEIEALKSQMGNGLTSDKQTQLEQQIEALNAEKAGLDEDIAEKDKEIEGLKDDLSEKEEKISDLEDEVRSLKVQIADLRNQLETSQEDLRQHKNRLDSMSSKYQDLEVLHASVSQELEFYKTKAPQPGSNDAELVKQLEKQVASIGQQLKDAQAQNSTLEQEKLDLEKIIANIEGNLEKDLSEIIAEQKRLEEEVSAKDELIAQLKNQLGSKSDGESDSLQQQIAQLEKENEELKAENQSLKDLIKSQDSDHKSILDEILAINSKALDSDFAGYQSGTFNKEKYQIFFFNACTTFSYYNQNYFNFKKSKDDPSGTQNLDILNVTTVNYFKDMADQNYVFLEGLLKGHRPSWQAIVDNMNQVSADETPMISVSGDEDNVYQKTPQGK